MFILTLIAVAFADLTRKNLIDISQNQLNLQAHYAAEAAINDVRAGLHQQLNEARQSSGVGGGVSVTPPGTSGFLDNPNPAANARFGSAVAMSGFSLAVGAPGQGVAYIFENTTSTSYEGWLSAAPTSISPPSGFAGGEFGASVSLNGGYLAVGAPGHDGSKGAVHIFSRRNQGDPWVLQKTLSGSIDSRSLQAGDRFGASLFVRDNMLLVGAPGQGSGAVYHFTKSGSDFNYELSWHIASSSSYAANKRLIIAGLNTGFGAGVNYSAGKLAISSTGGQGRIYVLQQVTASDKDSWDIANSDEIYDQGSGASSQTPNHVDADLGGATALERTLLAVAEPDADGNVGAIELLRLEANSWKWQHRISSLDPPAGDTSRTKVENLNAGDLFGSALALGDNLLAAGAPGHSGGQGRLWFMRIENNDILGDVWSFGSDFDCPDEEDAHPSWSNGRLTEDDSVEYSCVVVDVSPVDLIYDNVDTNRSLVLPLQAVDKDNNHLNLNKLVIEWDNTDSQSGGRPRSETARALTDKSGWQDTASQLSDLALLRLQVIPVNTSQAFDRDDLNANNKVFFLYPNEGKNQAGAGVHNYQSSNSGSILAGNCLTGSRENTDAINGASQLLTCRVVLDNLPLPNNIEPAGHTTGEIVYIVRIQAVYNSARLLITGDAGSVAGQPLLEGFTDIQAIITATGRAINVFERLEERIPLRPVFDLPEYAIDSEETVCKLLASDSGQRGAHISLNDKQQQYYVGSRDINRLPNCWINIHGSSPKAEWP